MPNALFTGVTGLRTNQQMLDVVGNNLANSNTTGFKSQGVNFSDLVYQTLAQGTAASGLVGGTDPLQVGLGAQVATISANLSQGSLESSGRDLDMALQGNGFFAARNGQEIDYTRAGSFSVDSSNYLVDPANGYRVQRFGAVGEGSATSPAFQVANNNDIKIPIGTGIPGNVTGNVVFQGNLSASAVGPLAQTLTSAQPFKSGGSPATLATTLNSLDDNRAPYVAGDTLVLQGVTVANTPVNVSLAAGPATTVGDVINAINANFPGSLASLDANSNLVVKANATGANNLSVVIADGTTNTGASSWGSHTLAATTTGKAGDTVKTGIQIYDAQGTAHNLDVVFQKQGNNTWNLTAQVNPSEGTMIDNLVSNINFNQNGSFDNVTGTGLRDPTITVQFNGFAAPQKIGFSFGTSNGFDGLTQVGGSSSAVATSQDGFAAGFLTSLTVGQDGVINGIFTNGRSLALAQLAIANFANPAALDRIGSNYYALSTESGPPLIGGGLSEGRGSVQQRQLESSNVDISLEFTRLITAQRGFEVNAHVITAADQILQALTNIIH